MGGLRKGRQGRLRKRRRSVATPQGKKRGGLLRGQKKTMLKKTRFCKHCFFFTSFKNGLI